MTGTVWRKSSRSSNNDDSCVEVAHAEDRVLVRDSKFPAGRRLAFGPVEWRAFLAGIRR